MEEETINNTPKVTNCTDSRCKTCNELKTGNQVIFKNPNQITTFKIKTNMNCGVREFLYLINCYGCNTAQYIGESEDTLRHRRSVHRNQISHPHLLKLQVSKHISLRAIAKNPMFTICPFYKIYRQDEIFRKEKEEYFRIKFKPTLNKDEQTGRYRRDPIQSHIANQITCQSQDKREMISLL